MPDARLNGRTISSWIAALALLALPAPWADAEPPISAQLRLIKRLGPDAYRDEPFRAPYIAVFRGDKKLLVFVSGDHGNGVNSTVARTIRLAFRRFKPRAVVVEGLSGDNPVDTRKWLDDAAWFAKNRPEELAENYYPATLAHQRKIPFAGGEPSLREKLKALEPFGYSASDVIGLGVAAQVGSMNSESPQNPRGLAKALDHHLMQDARELGLKDGFRYADFERWYARRGGIGKQSSALSAEDCKPSAEPGANFLQTLAYRLEFARESSIVLQIERMLNRHDRVLVVYGSGHLVRQRDVWKQALGPSSDSKPF